MANHHTLSNGEYIPAGTGKAKPKSSGDGDDGNNDDHHVRLLLHLACVEGWCLQWLWSIKSLIQNILMLRTNVSRRKGKYYQQDIFTWIGVLFGELGDEVGILVTLGT